MRRIWLLAAAVLIGTSASAVPDQIGSHLDALEPAVKSELTIPTEVVVGTCILKAGVYLVMCDRETVTFTLKSTGERMGTLSCRGSIMKDRAKETRAVYVKQPSGYVYLEKLYLKGNNVEHVF